MMIARRLARAASRWAAILGPPGLIVGVVSLAALAFSVLIQVREYDLLRRTGRAASERAIASWALATPVDEVGRTLPDYAELWRGEPESPARLGRLEVALATLGLGAEVPDPSFAVVAVETLRIVPRGGAAVAVWESESLPTPGIAAASCRFAMTEAGAGASEAIDLHVRYRPGPIVEEALSELETSYRRLLLAILGLSGYSLLCLAAMVVQARALSDRAGRESAQRATLDLADRTCHELGNIVFVLSNERRNLDEHLDQFDRLLDALPTALTDAIADLKLDPDKAPRVRRALDRRLSDLGLDPEIELRNGAAVARDVARQIAVCSEYIALTVRELDGYLKQSTMPVAPAPTRVVEAIDEALTLLGPRLESASAAVDRPSSEADALVALADRRLLVHALVNLLKNALEATSSAGRIPRITLSAARSGPSILLGVLDNGPGVPPELASRLFETGVSTKGRGRGRGLAIARDSIRAQGGTLRHSRPESGLGARFEIVLPASQAIERPGTVV